MTTEAEQVAELRQELREAKGILRYAMEAIEGGRAEPLAVTRTAIINFFNCWGIAPPPAHSTRDTPHAL